MFSKVIYKKDFKYSGLILFLLMIFATVGAAKGTAQMSSEHVIEFRIYDLVPDHNGKFLPYFDQHFIESQEQAGAKLFGQYDNLQNGDQFIFLREFQSMAQRKEALSAFYGGPVWAEYKSVANSLMSTWDNVRLLKPAFADSGFDPNLKRPCFLACSQTKEDWAENSGVVSVVVFEIYEGKVELFLKKFRDEILQILVAQGGQNLGLYVTEKSENTFPDLPVLQKSGTVVWFGAFSDQEVFKSAKDKAFEGGKLEILAPLIAEQTEYLLKPSSRSRLYFRSE